MLKKKEILNFEEEKKPEYIHIIINEEKYGDIILIDFSIFTPEECEYLIEINEEFKKCQRGLESDSDDYYSWLYNKDNPNREKNLAYKNKVYWLDIQLKENFGDYLENLFPSNLYDTKCREELFEIYTELKNKYVNMTKDKLRKWFVDNLSLIEEYYNEIK